MGIVSILNKRSTNHPNWCEDNYYLYEDDKKIIGAVLDGCSSAKDSFWTSKTFSYIFNVLSKEWNNFIAFQLTTNLDNFTNELFVDFAEKLKIIANTLSLTDMELLSTIIFFVYRKEEQKLYVKFLGDGAFYYKVDGELHLIENDENNMPLYLGYYFNNLNGDFLNYLKTRVKYEIANVQEFAICTDGIFSFFIQDNKKELLEENIQNPINYLLADDYLAHLKSGLSRKFNILTKSGWVIEDDLTVIKYK